MKNTKVKLTIWGVILATGVIFLLQNRSPVIGIVILGSETPALPVGIWLILSAIAGLISSILLQALLGVFVPRARRPREWDDEEESEFDFREVEADQRERFKTETAATPEKNEPPNRSESVNYTVGNAFDNSDQDWEFPAQREDWNEMDDDWNIEEPPRPANDSRRDRADAFYDTEADRQNRLEERSVNSNRQEPTQRNQPSSQRPFEGEEISIDRYNQQEDESGGFNTPQVYDASYRVIRPPLWNLPEDENEEDDETDQR